MSLLEEFHEMRTYSSENIAHHEPPTGTHEELPHHVDGLCLSEGQVGGGTHVDCECALKAISAWNKSIAGPESAVKNVVVRSVWFELDKSGSEDAERDHDEGGDAPCPENGADDMNCGAYWEALWGQCRGWDGPRIVVDRSQCRPWVCSALLKEFQGVVPIIVQIVARAPKCHHRLSIVKPKRIAWCGQAIDLGY